MLSHIFATIILTFTCLLGMFKFSLKQPKYLRLTFEIVIMIQAVVAFIGLLYASGVAIDTNVLGNFKVFEVVFVCLLYVLYAWGFLLEKDVNPFIGVLFLLIGGAVIFYTWDLVWRPMQKVFQSFCLISAMSIGSLGMLRRKPGAVWLVIGFMAYTLSLKATQLHSNFIHSFDLEQYLKVLCLICVYKGVSFKYKPEL